MKIKNSKNNKVIIIIAKILWLEGSRRNYRDLGLQTECRKSTLIQNDLDLICNLVIF